MNLQTTSVAGSKYCEDVILNDVALRYLRNTLPDKERDDFEQHYFRCETCTNVIRVLEPLVASFPAPRSAVSISALDRQRIVDALNDANGNQTRAAAGLGIRRRTFVALLDQYKIARPQRGWSGDLSTSDEPGPSAVDSVQSSQRAASTRQRFAWPHRLQETRSGVTLRRRPGAGRTSAWSPPSQALCRESHGPHSLGRTHPSKHDAVYETT